jgi:ribonucleoside-diphosphate reductase alpha chain
MHRAEVNNIGKSKNSAEPFFVPQLDQLIEASRNAWDGALAHGEKHGYRNSQVTVLAPTGTIGFMMDCDTTGIEPDLALVKYKKLVGGGMIKIVNNTVPSALIKLGYSESEVNAIVSYIDATGTIEGAPAIKPEHLAVFDCSFKPSKGTRSISYMGHIKMMGATQPFLSGAISKTVNLPQDCSVDDIAEAYMESWRQGLKAVAIYRDNSKGTQPLNVTAQTDDDKKGTRSTNVAGTRSTVSSDKNAIAPVAAGTIEIEEAVVAAKAAAKAETLAEAQAAQQKITALETQLRHIAEAAMKNSDSVDAQSPPRAVRHRLPAERASVTHKFGLAGHEGYITVGLYPNGQPGEIFIRMAKEGSTVSGLMDSFATAVSLALQHGVPLRVLCEKFAHTRFEPSGWTGNEQIGYAKSIMDYIFRWIQIRFLSGHQLDLFTNLSQSQAQQSIPVEGAVISPGNTIVPSLNASLLDFIAPLPSSAVPSPDDYYTTTPPQQGIASEPSAAIAKDLAARSGIDSSDLSSFAEGGGPDSAFQMEDRGVYHVTDAMKSMYDMGDSPSCATCGAIMTRSGSCYRCMSCGSTSGCS